jgi:hypothetical protein
MSVVINEESAAQLINFRVSNASGMYFSESFLLNQIHLSSVLLVTDFDDDSVKIGIKVGDL